MIGVCKNKVEQCNSIYEIIGYEGQGAKYYFTGLSKCIKEEFEFYVTGNIYSWGKNEEYTIEDIIVI